MSTLERLAGERVSSQQQLKTTKAEQAAQKGVANLQRDGLAGDSFAAAVKVILLTLHASLCLGPQQVGKDQDIGTTHELHLALCCLIALQAVSRSNMSDSMHVCVHAPSPHQQNKTSLSGFNALLGCCNAGLKFCLLCVTT